MLPDGPASHGKSRVCDTASFPSVNFIDHINIGNVIPKCPMTRRIWEARLAVRSFFFEHFRLRVLIPDSGNRVKYKWITRTSHSH